MQLEDYLLGATVRVRAGPRVGTGFHVAPNLVVTCAHLVEDPANGDYPLPGVEVLRDGERHPAAIVRYASSPDPDLAVLETVPAWDRCAFLLGSVRESDRLYICGSGDDGEDPVRLHASGSESGPSELALGRPLALGIDVPETLEGAPVLNLRTGAVCAIVSGPQPRARAVPVSIIGRLFPEIRRAHDAWHDGNPAWFECEAPESTAFAARRQVLASRWLCQAPIQPFLVPRSGRPPLELNVGVELEEVGGGLPGRRLDIDAALERSRKRGRNLLVVGRSGSGRSSVLRMVGHRRAGSFSNLGAMEGSDVFPILVRANQLADDDGPVQDRIAAALGEDLPSGFLADLVETPGLELLLMIDGVDEIQDKRDLADLVGFIGRILEDPELGPRTQLLVTSRLSAAEHFRYARFDVYAIQPLGPDAVGTAAEHWLGPAAPEFMEAGSDLLRSGMLASPLALAVALKLYENRPGELPRRVVDRYGRLVADCVDVWSSPRLVERYGRNVIDQAADVLGFLALELLRTGTDMTDDSTLETVRRFLATHARQSADDVDSVARRFLEFLTEDGFFLQREGDGFYWSHLGFRDFFAASCLVRLFQRGGGTVETIRRRWFDANWGHTPGYALELLESPSEREAIIEEVAASGRVTRLRFLTGILRDGVEVDAGIRDRLIEALLAQARTEEEAADLPFSPEDPSALELLLSLAYLDAGREALEGIAADPGWSRRTRERVRARLGSGSLAAG